MNPRWPHLSNAFPFASTRLGQLGDFFAHADWSTLRQRFGEAYWNQFIRRSPHGAPKSSYHWVFMHGIIISCTLGFLLHQKHQRHIRHEVLHSIRK
jgi:hypothetical protein